MYVVYELSLFSTQNVLLVSKFFLMIAIKTMNIIKYKKIRSGLSIEVLFPSFIISIQFWLGKKEEKDKKNILLISIMNVRGSLYTEYKKLINVYVEFMNYKVNVKFKISCKSADYKNY